jgi:UDP-N-acetylmuramoylalanine--D-glutamate ligase
MESLVLNKLKDKRILIFGFGREGQDTFKFLRKLFPKKRIAIADKATGIKKPDKDTMLHLGKNYLAALEKYDVVIKSPGIPFKILPRAVSKKITTQTEIFFENCPGRIIGITGTKGKSTTSSMIYRILKAGGLKAHLIGNIGKPVLASLLKAGKKDVFVYELSSHQLYSLKKSPHIAVLLNIFPEHLDYYKSFEEYAQAKANITLWQTKNDYLIYNVQDKTVGSISKKTKARKIPIKGKYYELDTAAARAAARIFRIPGKIIDKSIKTFKHLPHRLEPIGTFRGITFYNDALATIPEATISAINRLGNKVETIILGGFDRNIDFKKLAEEILRSRIKTLIFFPTTGEKIWRTIVRQNRKKRKFNRFFVNSMAEAVKLAYQYTKKGKICLLSTASASFGIFKDYKEKGDLFKKNVRKYGCDKKS